jgi:lipoprotein-anchoring transpeptidase ErfK/SrfK
MKRTSFIIGCLLAVGGATVAQAADVPAKPPTTAPSTQPSVDMKALIAQLGAEDFHDRDRAAAQLRKIGKEALPVLKEAQNDPDPEIQARAGQLVKELERKARPVIPRRFGQGFGTSTSMSTSVQITRDGRKVVKSTRTVTTDNSREITVTENGRRVAIKEDGSGIHMTVTQKVDGEETSTAYEAADPDDLKENHADAFKIYKQYVPEDR